MNHDIFSTLRLQADMEIRNDIEAQVQARYTELLEQEIITLRKQDTTKNMLVDVLMHMSLTELERIKILRAAYNLSLADARALIHDYLPF